MSLSLFHVGFSFLFFLKKKQKWNVISAIHMTKLSVQYSLLYEIWC